MDAVRVAASDLAGKPTMHPILFVTLLSLLMLPACGPGGLRAGGQYSGVPDTVMGDPQRNYVTGTISTGGTIRSRRDGYLTTPTGR